MAGRRTGPVERAHVRAYAAHTAAEQPNDLDLVGDLIERDAAALSLSNSSARCGRKEKVVVVEGQNHPELANSPL